jgi:hypothetical protein
MIKRGWVCCALALGSLTGCTRSGELVVQTRFGRDTAGQPAGLDRIEITLLPYNRDSIFDALTRRAPRPRPEIPADLLALRDSLDELRRLWTEAESQWNAVRDELQRLGEQMGRMNRASREYAQAFARFTELERRYRALEQAKDAAFRRYDELQKRYATRADSVKIARFNWEEEAFAEYVTITDSLLERLGRQIYVDTTAGGGWASFKVPAGRWYVYTTYELPFRELYFNIPVEIRAGRTDTLILTPDTAEVRPLL